VIIINGIGCYSLAKVKPDNFDDIEKGEVVKITTQDNKVYYLIDVEFQYSKILGHEYVNNDTSSGRKVEILTEEIKKIEVEEFDWFISAAAITLDMQNPLANSTFQM
jgi:hypothetical protein